tara:strand:- start:293 stop:916 length:624 start_codon:yes stop_codon:yes gene_type:complete
MQPPLNHPGDGNDIIRHVLPLINLSIKAEDEIELELYVPVTQSVCMKLATELRNADKKLSKDGKVILRVNSMGGDLYAAFLVVDTIREMNHDVHTIVDGVAASAATIITMAGTVGFRTMHEHSRMLLHMPKMTVAGSSMIELGDLQVYEKNMKSTVDAIKKFYKTSCATNITDEDLDKYLATDIWYTANKCKECGFVDAVIKYNVRG